MYCSHAAIEYDRIKNQDHDLQLFKKIYEIRVRLLLTDTELEKGQVLIRLEFISQEIENSSAH